MRFKGAVFVCAVVCASAVPARAATIAVPAGGDLQQALNAAQGGDTIVLDAGAVYRGNFVLPVHGGSGDVTVTTGGAGLPAAGVRVTPDVAPRLATIQSPNSVAALRTAAGAHHWTLVLLAFGPNAQGYGDIIELGDGSSAQNTLAAVPHDLLVDRVYVHGDPAYGQKRGIALNSAATTIENSYIADCKAVGQDSQAIGGWNGPGPYVIQNNYLEGAGENVLFGGADPSIPNLVPSDITVRGNYLSKPLAWRSQQWQVKNVFELKNAQRVIVDGNVMENNWLAAQSGYAVLFTPRNQGGTAPWSVVQHVTFTNNVVRHVSSAVNILGTDNLAPSQTTNDIVVRNNLFADVSGAAYGGSGRFLLVTGGFDVTIDHNTVVQDGSSAIYAYGSATTGFVFTNNIVPDNSWAFIGDGTGPGNNTVGTYFPGGVFTDNAIAGAPSSRYPAANYYPASMAAVGFVDYAAGNYTLASASPYVHAGTDGGDVGANLAVIALDAAAATGGGTGGPTLAVLTGWLAQAVRGTPYSATLQYAGGPGATPVWTLAGGELPAGMTLSAAGLIAGTPTTTGDFAVLVGVGDPSGLASAGAAWLTIHVVPPPAVLTAEGQATGTIDVPAGGAVSVSVANGPANAADWVALAPVGSPDATYPVWRYLNGSTTMPAVGVAASTLTLPVPSTPGAYETRLFANNGFTRLATGPIVQVTAVQPSIVVNGSASPVTVAPGDTISVAIAGAPGNRLDWAALAGRGTPATSFAQWAYLGGATAASAVAMTSATLSFTAPPASGTYEVRLFLDNGYSLAATSAIITVAVPVATPMIAVNGVGTGAVTATVGDSITVSVTNGPANPTDWVALAPLGSPDGTYPVWRYLNGQMSAPATGSSSATISMPLPASPGDYEVRLFASNGFARLATGPTIHVQRAQTAITLNGVTTAVTVGAGSVIAVTVTGGPGHRLDWVALAARGAPATSFLQWTYLSGTATAASAAATTAGTVTFVAPAQPGDYEIRLFADNGYSLVAASAALTVAAPAVSINGVSDPGATVTVPAGATATVAVSGASGSATDWVGVYSAGAANTTFLDWVYLSGSRTPPAAAATSGTVTLTLPSSPGTYEFRLLWNNGYTVLARSPHIVVP